MHLSSARDLRSTSEAALKAFWVCFWSKLRAQHLNFLALFLPLAAAFLLRVVGVVLFPFDIASLLRVNMFLAFRCSGGTVLRASEGLTKPLGATSTYSALFLCCVPKMPKPVVATEAQAHGQAKVARSTWGHMHKLM